MRERTGSARDRGSSALWEPIQKGTEKTCRAALGEEGFAAVLAEGRALPVTDAVHEALAVAALLAAPHRMGSLSSSTANHDARGAAGFLAHRCPHRPRT